MRTEDCNEGKMSTNRKACTLVEIEVARLIIERSAAVQAQAGHVRRETVDGVHDMRVASRRLRAVLGEFSGRFPRAPLKAFRGHARSITRGLGRARELDVTLGLVESRPEAGREEMDGARRFVAERVRGRREKASKSVQGCAEVVDSESYGVALEEVLSAYRKTKSCYRKTGARRLKRGIGKAARRYAEWTNTKGEEDLHALRIQIKKLRYVGEIYGPLYGKDMKGFLKRLKESQEALGAWNDHRVFKGYLESFRREAPGALARGISLLEEKVDSETIPLLEEVERRTASMFSKEKQKALRDWVGKPHGECCHP